MMQLNAINAINANDAIKIFDSYGKYGPATCTVFNYCGVPINFYDTMYIHRIAMQLPRPDHQLILNRTPWNLIRGENEDGFTTLEFWRKWGTCDDLDRDIEVSTG